MIQKSERRIFVTTWGEPAPIESEHYSVGSKVWSSPITALSHNALPVKVKGNSTKLLPFQVRARRLRYHVDHIFNICRVNYRYFINLFDSRALGKYIEVLTFHFPSLYGFCSCSQQLKMKTRRHIPMFTPSTDPSTHSSVWTSFRTRYCEKGDKYKTGGGGGWDISEVAGGASLSRQAFASLLTERCLHHPGNPLQGLCSSLWAPEEASNPALKLSKPVRRKTLLHNTGYWIDNTVLWQIDELAVLYCSSKGSLEVCIPAVSPLVRSFRSELKDPRPWAACDVF